jgi:hypothetical protein
MKTLELKNTAKAKGINIVSINKNLTTGRYFTFGEGWSSETKDFAFNSTEELEYWIENF